jgi:hypothetical protein
MHSDITNSLACARGHTRTPEGVNSDTVQLLLSRDTGATRLFFRVLPTTPSVTGQYPLTGLVGVEDELQREGIETRALSAINLEGAETVLLLRTRL